MAGPYQVVYQVDHFMLDSDSISGYFYRPCPCSNPLVCGGEYQKADDLIKENLLKFPELKMLELECAAIQWLEDNKAKQKPEMEEKAVLTDLTTKDFIVQMVEEATGAPPPAAPVPLPFYRDPNRENLWKIITVINTVAIIIVAIIIAV